MCSTVTTIHAGHHVTLFAACLQCCSGPLWAAQRQNLASRYMNSRSACHTVNMKSFINTTLTALKALHPSLCRFHQECEAAINEQINIEYTISYVYHSLALIL